MEQNPLKVVYIHVRLLAFKIVWIYLNAGYCVQAVENAFQGQEDKKCVRKKMTAAYVTHSYITASSQSTMMQ